MQRRSVAVLVCVAYFAYCSVILSHALLAGVARPRGHMAPWFICATLGLLCYGMYARRSWARVLGLVVGIGSLLFWAMVYIWGYAFSGFGSRSGEPTFYFPMLWAIVPPVVLSISLIVLLAKPLPGDALRH